MSLKIEKNTLIHQGRRNPLDKINPSNHKEKEKQIANQGCITKTRTNAIPIACKRKHTKRSATKLKTQNEKNKGKKLHPDNRL